MSIRVIVISDFNKHYEEYRRGEITWEELMSVINEGTPFTAKMAMAELGLPVGS